jgi:hypothetical protein
MMRSQIFVAFVATALWTAAGVRPEAQRAADPCAVEGVSRIVAIGDVHGAYDNFVAILKAAGIIDGRNRWSGGPTYLVQTGDVVDRGADSRRALDLLRRLQKDAPKARGRVLPLVGNHEAMRLLGEMRDTSAGEIAAFRTGQSAEIRDAARAVFVDTKKREAEAGGQTVVPGDLAAAFDAGTPLGLVEMLTAFSARGDYGKWIRENTAAARINGILFLHGGVSERVAPLGCEGINAGVRTDLTTGLEQVRRAPLESLAMSEDGPLWYRGLAREEDAAFAPEVEKILATVNARAIVIGHTVSETGRIRPRFDGRVVQIDTGMLTSVYKGGRPSALEIAGDRWTAIYEDGRVPLAGPAKAAPTPPSPPHPPSRARAATR